MRTRAGRWTRRGTTRGGRFDSFAREGGSGGGIPPSIDPRIGGEEERRRAIDRARSIGRTLPNGNARIVSVSDSGPTPREIAATSRGLSSTSPTVTLIVRARE